MNRATYALQDSDNPTSDNLTPEETTEEESGTVGADEADLSCPSISVVAESRQDDSALAPLIKSPAPIQPEVTQDTQDEEFPSVSEDEA